MSNDSHLFRTAPGRGLVPLYEAKMIHQFDHRWATYTGDSEDGARGVTEEEKGRVDYEVRPRYWVPQTEVEERLEAKGWTRPWLLGWRDICRATDERTTIATVIPRVGVGNKIPVILFSSAMNASSAACLLALLSSVTLDYVSRQKIGGTTMNFFIFKQLAVVPPNRIGSQESHFLASRVARLTCTSSSMAGWADELSVAVLPTAAPESRAALRAELDAMSARLYGISRDELAFVLDPERELGGDYPTETFRVLKKNELDAFGEYRTRRLVLEAWDRLFGS
jgi:hypothetical protein